MRQFSKTMTTVTFGKHRGNPLEELAQDLSYLDWLEQQPWWPEKWEYQALLAMQNGLSVPEPPAKRPILEEEYDLSKEKPAKVRKLTHRDFSDRARTTPYECPNCAAYTNMKRLISNSSTAMSVMCSACGQHGEISLEFTSGVAQVHFRAKTCPSWENVDYKQACAQCPERKGIYKDHTKCGCWKAYECACKVQK